MCCLWYTPSVSKSRSHWAEKWKDLQSWEGTPCENALPATLSFLNQSTASSQASAGCSCHGVIRRERWALGDSTPEHQTLTLLTLQKHHIAASISHCWWGNTEFKSHLSHLLSSKKRSRKRIKISFLKAKLSAVSYVSKTATDVFLNVKDLLGCSDLLFYTKHCCCILSTQQPINTV